MTADAVLPLARWLVSAVLAPLIGFWVSVELPLGDVGPTSSGLGYLIIGIQNLALFAFVFCVAAPVAMPMMARRMPLAFACAVPVVGVLVAHCYFQMDVDDVNGTGRLALAVLRNLAIGLMVAAVLFIFLGLRCNPIFERLRRPRSRQGSGRQA